MLYSSQLHNHQLSSPANESRAGKWADQTSQNLHLPQLGSERNDEYSRKRIAG